MLIQQPALFKTEITVITNNNMIQQENINCFSDIRNPLRNADVITAGFRVAARMIVKKHNMRCLGTECADIYFSR